MTLSTYAWLCLVMPARCLDSFPVSTNAAAPDLAFCFAVDLLRSDLALYV